MDLTVAGRRAFAATGGRAFDPPVDLAGSDGLRFRCSFENPRDKEVRWGIENLEISAARIKELGGDPFRDYSLPEAILKFRQGIGHREHVQILY